MPLFTVERQYLVPVYEHITIEAADAAAACHAALDEETHPWGDHAKTDYESSRASTISGVWAGARDHVGDCLDIPAELEQAS